MKKIAIPTDNNIAISNHFIEAKWFKVIDVENGQPETNDYIENKFHASVEEGKCKKEVMDIMQNVDIIITREMNSKLQEELQSVNKKIVFTDTIPIDTAVEEFLKQKN